MRYWLSCRMLSGTTTRTHTRLRLLVPDPTGITHWVAVIVEYMTDPAQVVTLYARGKAFGKEYRL